MKRQTQQIDKKGVPASVIIGAVKGHQYAMDIVLMHYNNYILTLATRPVYDIKGVCHYCVDDEFYIRMRSKLMYAVLNFKFPKLSNQTETTSL